jgi:hypothetical protein
VDNEDNTPEMTGPDAPAKLGAIEEGEPQPEQMEVESARQLEMDAAPTLEGEGLPRERIRELADAYIALDVGTDTDEFIAWVHENRAGG